MLKKKTTCINFNIKQLQQNRTKMYSTPTIKKIIYIFDIICFLLAAVLIGFGVYTILTYHPTHVAEVAAYAYIGIGVATFVVFIFLNVGAIRENVCCTITFVVLMVVIILAQAATTFLLTQKQDDVASTMAIVIDSTWEDEIKSPGQAMSIYETMYHCCGRASPQDYIVNERLPPDSCFENSDSTIPENLIESGCRVKFESYWSELLSAFNIVSWVLIAMELILSFISCCLCNSIRNDRRRTYY